MLDFTSLTVIFIAIMLTNIMIFVLHYKFSRIEVKSFIYWIIAYVLHTSALVIYVITTANFSIYLIMIQTLFIFITGIASIFGTQQLLNRKVSYKFVFLILLYLPVIFIEIYASLEIYEYAMILSIFNLVIYSICTYYTFKTKIEINNKFILHFRIVLILFVILNAFNIIFDILQLDPDYETRHILNSSLLIFETCIHLSLTFAILYVIYGINQYKFVELEFKYQKQLAIKDSEQKFKQLFEQMPLGIAVHQMIYDGNQKPLDYRFININKGFEIHTSLKAEDIIGKTMKEIIPGTESIWFQRYDKVIKQQKTMSFTGYAKNLNRHFEIVAYPLDHDKFVTIVHNTTSEINKEQELQILTTHDYLTLLKNRHEFIKDLETFSLVNDIAIELILFDIDGFSIFNDAFGNNIGDSILIKVANTIVKYTKSNNNIYRVGGDSFAIILNNSDIVIKKYINSLQKKIENIQYKDVKVSVTFANHLKTNQSVNAFINLVEKQLIKNKEKKEKSHYSLRVASLLETLTEKYEDEKSHSNRVKIMCEQMGKAMQLSKEDIVDLTLAGNLHDIGKIAIPEEILHKPAKLTDEEYEIIKTHAEIGYRILNAVEEYQRVALATLYHHERYDGSGYPKGIKGEEIPLFSRIISVVDAYEAMVSDRVYRKAPGKAYAIEELRRCSGTQFDPKIVNIFIECIAE